MKRIYIYFEAATGTATAYTSIPDMCRRTGHTYAAAKKGLERSDIHTFRNGDTIQRSYLFTSKGRSRSGKAAMEALKSR